MGAEKVVLTWTFKPSDYFEQSISVSREDYTMSRGQGTAVRQLPRHLHGHALWDTGADYK